jgi:hypothetical protein
VHQRLYQPLATAVATDEDEVDQTKTKLVGVFDQWFL